MSKAPPPPRSGSTIGRLLIYALFISVGIILLYNYFRHSEGGAAFGNYTSVPKELQINYLPADFTFDLDEEAALAILTNPHRYRREFNELVYDVNRSILQHVAQRMGLPDSVRIQLIPKYEEHHPYLRQLYFNDFVAISDTTANLYETWYNNANSGALDVFREVASKYTCFLVNHVLMGLVESQGGKLYVKGSKVDSPCGIALTEALRPMMERLQERAAVADFSRSKGLLEEKVERMIAELATMEVRDKKAINKQLQTKIWGYAVSSTDIEVSAISVLKVGFKLNDYFDIDLDRKRKTLRVTLPEPVILSHEVYPKIDKLDIGWMREVKEMDLNANFNHLRAEFRREALESDLLAQSKTQADDLMKLIFEPILLAHHRGYQVSVNYRRTSPAEPERSQLPPPEARSIPDPQAIPQ